MLNKKNRLITKEVEKIFGNGRIVNSPSLRLKYIQSESGLLPNQSRFAVIVSSKIFKDAHKRVGARRKVYAVVRPLLSRLKKSVFAIIFVNDISKMNHKDLSIAAENLFIKAGFL
jgi:ribonuclease P protein component